MPNYSHRFRLVLIALLLLLTFSIFANGQKYGKKPAVKTDKIGRLIQASGFEYESFGTSVWKVECESNTLIVGGGPDSFVAFITIAKKGTFQITAESMSDMLKLAGELDRVKIIITEEGDLQIQMDFMVGLMNQATFKDALLRVSYGYDQGVYRIAPFLIK